MDLLNQKLSLIKEITLVSEKLSQKILRDEFLELESVLSERQELIEKAALLNKQIEENNIESNEDIDEEFEIELNKIKVLDKHARDMISKKDFQLRKKYLDLDTRLKTGNLIITEDVKKPKGYFLNTKN